MPDLSIVSILKPIQSAGWLFSSPFLVRTITLLAILQGVRLLNRYLTRSAQNNWVRTAPWNPSNEIALVTGGSNGIGRQIVHDLAALGLKAVIIWDVKEPEWDLCSNTHYQNVNLTSTTCIEKAARTLRKTHGHPSILINNAGLAFSSPLLSSTEAETSLTLDVNVLSHFRTVREFLPAMLDSNHGHVVTVASMASFAGCAGLVAYSASKAALLGFHEGLRQEVRHFYRKEDAHGKKIRGRVRTSIIHPLYVATPMTSVLVENRDRFRRPFLGAQDVSAAVVRQIVNGDSGQIVVPASQWVVALLRGMPGWMQELVRDYASRGFVRLRTESSAANVGIKK